MPHFFRHFAPMILSSLTRTRTRTRSSFVPVRAVGNATCKVKKATTEWSAGPSCCDEYVELGECKGAQGQGAWKGGGGRGSE